MATATDAAKEEFVHWYSKMGVGDIGPVPFDWPGVTQERVDELIAALKEAIPGSVFEIGGIVYNTLQIQEARILKPYFGLLFDPD